jgi:hypothetical protein
MFIVGTDIGNSLLASGMGRGGQKEGRNNGVEKMDKIIKYR